MWTGLGVCPTQMEGVSMPAERFELRISASRLLIGLLVIIIPISIAGLYSLAHSDRALECARLELQSGGRNYGIGSGAVHT